MMVEAWRVLPTAGCSRAKGAVLGFQGSTCLLPVQRLQEMQQSGYAVDAHTIV